MRIFPIGCEVIFTRPDDPWKGQIGKIIGEPSENGRYLVEVGNTTKLRHGDDMCEASQYMKEKAMQDTQLSQVTDLNQLVRNTNAIIEIDVDGAIAYIDKRVADTPLDELEPELRKWYKDLGEKRLQLTRPVNESLKQVIADEKKIGDYINKIFAENQAKKDAAEAERKKAKHTEVMAIMADMLNDVDLPPEYLAKVIFREEYYQKTMVNKKLKDSIQEQIDTQVNLYNGWKAEQELRQQLIKNREMQIAMLNKQYNANGTYSMFTIETHTDEQVVARYEANHQRKLEQARLEKERQDAEEIKKQAVTEPSNQDVNLEESNFTSSEKAVKSSITDSEGLPNELKPTSDCEASYLSRQSSVTKTFTITIDAGDATTSTEAMATVEKRLAEMSHNFATKYGIKMELCQA